MERLETHKQFGGTQDVYQHASAALGGDARVGVFLPPQAADGPCPVLYFLAGLTCTEQNFITKAGAQRFAADHGVILVAPDTSPRGVGVPDDDAYDLGQGAGFYLNATQAPWAPRFAMYDYITQELPAWVDANFPTLPKRAIMGHSMGGHGALVIALKNPGMFTSASAFAPIVAPTQVPWGHKAFTAYLGEDRELWRAWDACELVASATEKLPLLVDQGTADNFLDAQLQPERLQAACDRAGHPLTLRMQAGYDHSYYFISTFVGEHVAFHAQHLARV
jgi:S-formylglutathione hydrolase